jgi:hypothetical protein
VWDSESCGESKNGKFHEKFSNVSSLCALRFFVFGRGNYISGEQWRGENQRGLAAEVGEEPEKEREGEAEEEASDDGEVDGCVFAAVDDVAGKFSQAQREFAAEVEKRADDGEEAAEEEESAAEFAERLHRDIIGDELRRASTRGKQQAFRDMLRKARPGAWTSKPGFFEDSQV